MTQCAIVDAAKRGDYAAVEHQLESGDNADANGGEGTALWWAAYKGHGRVVTLLVSWGADLGAYYSGSTPEGAAKNNGKKGIAAELAAATQQPRKRPTPERWAVLGQDTVAFIGNYYDIGTKLTQVFNFHTRERLVIEENTQDNTRLMAPPTPFDDLPPSAVERALNEFERLGGKPDREYALHGQDTLGKSRKISGPEAGHA
jgi:hypothetical protein